MKGEARDRSKEIGVFGRGQGDWSEDKVSEEGGDHRTKVFRILGDKPQRVRTAEVSSSFGT